MEGQLPTEFTSLLDLAEYAWVAGIFYGRQLWQRVRDLEARLAATPSIDEKLDKIIGALHKRPDIILGD